jgi:hypothetical protein
VRTKEEWAARFKPVPGSNKKQQWVAHDGAGAQARRLRQLTKRRAKRIQKEFGVVVDEEGLTPSGLVLPGFEPGGSMEDSTVRDSGLIVPRARTPQWS